jgi:hypothetical protein
VIENLLDGRLAGPAPQRVLSREFDAVVARRRRRRRNQTLPVDYVHVHEV